MNFENINFEVGDVIPYFGDEYMIHGKIKTLLKIGAPHEVSFWTDEDNVREQWELFFKARKEYRETELENGLIV
jgi:hypothetical protein